MKLLTIEDRLLRNFAIVNPRARKVIWVYGGFFRFLLPQLLAKQPTLEDEVFDEKKRTRTLIWREVRESDDNFDEAVRQEFERQGLRAHLVSPRGARLHMVIRHSPLPRSLQNRIIFNLRRLADPQINELLAALKS